ncbi:hypothetical protein GALMADRAFT_209941 [Galerina marginata CBS 339.88]|uniref:DUF6589 domain-containing protein n=1 Tax=Galerina marginata (strain CBS 339.88) TaxID=685588 RepID=A0A067TFA1_GALM3|nr:hypothetical protein GALMADRAFT_209941 [Galerina marginata CBS 339.88]
MFDVAGTELLGAVRARLEAICFKKVYKAEGGSHSWDWLALVSPCVEILRKLATKINHELGTEQGSKHTIPDLEKDIATLMKVLKDHEVYMILLGRVVDSQDQATPDVIGVGLAQVSHGNSTNPIEEFNEEFDRLRERRKLTPISDELDFTNIPGMLSAAVPGWTTTKPTETSLDGDNIHGESDNVPQSASEASDSDSEGDRDVIDPRLEAMLMESPTLQRIDEGDVALDMDGWELEPESDEEMSEFDESEGEDESEWPGF